MTEAMLSGLDEGRHVISVRAPGKESQEGTLQQKVQVLLQLVSSSTVTGSCVGFNIHLHLPWRGQHRDRVRSDCTNDMSQTHDAVESHTTPKPDRETDLSLSCKWKSWALEFVCSAALVLPGTEGCSAWLQHGCLAAGARL